MLRKFTSVFMLVFMVGIVFAPFISDNTATCCDSLMDQCCCIDISETCEMEMTNCDIPIVLPIVSAPVNRVSVEKEIIVSDMCVYIISNNVTEISHVYGEKYVPDPPSSHLTPLLI